MCREKRRRAGERSESISSETCRLSARAQGKLIVRCTQGTLESSSQIIRWSGRIRERDVPRPSTDANETKLSSRSRADDDKYGSLNRSLDLLAAIARGMLHPSEGNLDDALSAEWSMARDNYQRGRCCIQLSPSHKFPFTRENYTISESRVWINSLHAASDRQSLSRP